MPSTLIHQKLTAAALKVVFPGCNDFADLINDYSSYLDFYYSERSAELEKYMYFVDGIQFHYLPDTPLNLLYRYWKMDGDKAFLSVPFVNENFRHAKSGFTFYMTNAVERLRLNERDEALKYLGCLLHMLEDSTFGFHAMEGPYGSDAFVLDRMGYFDFQPSALLAMIELREPLPDRFREAVSLGRSIDEAVMYLYTAYCRLTSDSRKCCFKYIMAHAAGDTEICKSLEDRMYCNAVVLCADVIKTVFDLASGKTCCRQQYRRGTEIEPYQFPFGGFGRFVFNSILTDHSVDLEGKSIGLTSAEKTFEYGFSFGSHHRGDFRWDIPHGIFKKFSAVLTFHEKYPVKGDFVCQLVNDGKVIETFTLDAQNCSKTLQIDCPCGEFGLSFRSTPATGIMLLGEPLFEYA